MELPRWDALRVAAQETGVAWCIVNGLVRRWDHGAGRKHGRVSWQSSWERGFRTEAVSLSVPHCTPPSYFTGVSTSAQTAQQTSPTQPERAVPSARTADEQAAAGVSSSTSLSGSTHINGKVGPRQSFSSRQSSTNWLQLSATVTVTSPTTKPTESKLSFHNQQQSFMQTQRNTLAALQF